MIVGITGSFGSGKTTVAKLFSRHHFNRIDADEIGHEIIKKNSVIYEKIIDNFGLEILDKRKHIDRSKLGDIVFNDNMKLKKLNSIMHPIIIKNIKNEVKRINKKCGYKTKIVIDAPLLIETASRNSVDKLIVVKCNKNIIIKRNKIYSIEKIERILKSQMPLSEKLRPADFVVDNNKDLESLQKQVEDIITKLKKYENRSLSWNF